MNEALLAMGAPLFQTQPPQCHVWNRRRGFRLQPATDKPELSLVASGAEPWQSPDFSLNFMVGGHLQVLRVQK